MWGIRDSKHTKYECPLKVHNDIMGSVMEKVNGENVRGRERP